MMLQLLSCVAATGHTHGSAAGADGSRMSDHAATRVQTRNPSGDPVVGSPDAALQTSVQAVMTGGERPGENRRISIGEGTCVRTSIGRTMATGLGGGRLRSAAPI